MKIRIIGGGYSYHVHRRIFGIWFTERNNAWGNILYDLISTDKQISDERIFRSVTDATHYISKKYIGDNDSSENIIIMEFNIYKRGKWMFKWLLKMKLCFHSWKYNGNDRYRICMKCRNVQMYDDLACIYTVHKLSNTEIKEIFGEV